MPTPTILDIVKANGNDALAGLIDETIKMIPELRAISARTIRGIGYRTRVRTALGNTTGSFRDANEGTEAIKHTYENRVVETYILSPRFECDKAVADRAEDGPQAYIATENQGIVQGEMLGLAKQFYYGGGNNAKGHPGLINMHDANSMVIDAGGTTANTGSSVWLIRTQGNQDVKWVWGENGLFAMSPVRIETVTPDPVNAPTKRFSAYVSDMTAYPGLQVGSVYSACRIKKLTADAGKGLTDALIAAALAKFPAGMGPDLILMSRRSRYQLQLSRTVVHNVGSGQPNDPRIANVADVPTQAFGIPIEATDAISDTESLTL